MSFSKMRLLFTSCMYILMLHVHSAVIENDKNEGNVQKKGELLFVHVLHRHGDRTPLEQFPGDKYDISYWPEGWGQLTNLGKQQHFALGKWLRSKYQKFLRETYNTSDVYVQSSDVDRTLMSVQSNLAGLFPPKKNQIWNLNLIWQPIPIHTMPVKTDNLLAGDMPDCSSFQKAFDKYFNESAKMKTFRVENQPLYELLSSHTGQPANFYYSVWDVENIYDAWICESHHNLPLPKWSKKLFPKNEKFYKAALKPFYLWTATPFLTKFSGGFLLQDLLNRFTSKVKHTLQPDRKFFIYSTHDSNIFNLLSALNVLDNKFVPYAAAIIFELRLYKNVHYVQIFYKNSNESPDPINIPGCGIACPLSKMYELYGKILPKNDFKTECQIDE